MTATRLPLEAEDRIIAAVLEVFNPCDTELYPEERRVILDAVHAELVPNGTNLREVGC